MVGLLALYVTTTDYYKNPCADHSCYENTKVLVVPFLVDHTAQPFAVIEAV